MLVLLGSGLFLGFDLFLPFTFKLMFYSFRPVAVSAATSRSAAPATTSPRLS
jgi:hypothetical protein